MMKTFEYPKQLKEMNEYINSLPASTCTFDNEKGTVLVEAVAAEGAVQE